MKKYLLMFLVLILLSCGGKEARNQKELVEIIRTEIPNPIKTYKLDIKTKFNDKTNFKPIKKGVIDLITSDGWGKVGEVGEDYVVWIENYNRYSIDSVIRKISFQLSITEKSMFKRKANLLSKNIDLEYTINEDWIDYQKDLDENKLLKALDNTTNDIKLEKGKFSNFSKNIVEVLGKSIKNARKEFGLDNEKIVEYHVVAGYTYVELKKMILDLEK